jgi:hypothetical protein
MLGALKHFAFVGLGFALIAGWLATLIVNTALGTLLEALLHAPPDNFFLGSALLTAVSISLIVVCIVVGNRLFRRWSTTVQLRLSTLLLSTALFLLVVLVFVVPQFGQVISAYANRTHYFYHHGSELLLMFSLPLARLVVLPTVYFVSARRGMCVTNRSETPRSSTSNA